MAPMTTYCTSDSSAEQSVIVVTLLFGKYIVVAFLFINQSGKFDSFFVQLAVISHQRPCKTDSHMLVSTTVFASPLVKQQGLMDSTKVRVKIKQLVYMCKENGMSSAHVYSIEKLSAINRCLCK